MTLEQSNTGHETGRMIPAAPDKDELRYRGIYYPIGFGVEIRTNDLEVIEAANEVWGQLPPRQVSATIQVRIGITEGGGTECPPAPGCRIARHLISFVADAENHAHCDLNEGFGFAWLSRAALNHGLYFRYHFLESIVMVLVSGKYAPALHAACISRHGRGMLLCGASGAGKSTLSYACARAGFTFTSDDASYLLRDADHPRVVGLSHKIRFRPASRAFFPELAARGLSPRLEGKPSIEIQTAELPGLITAPEARIHYLILLRRRTHAEARLIPIATSLALEDLHESLFPAPEVRRQQIAALKKFHCVEAFEFEYCDLDQAIRCLDGLCRGHGLRG